MLVGKYARLRIMDSKDAEYVRTLRNSPAVMRQFQHRHFISDVQQEAFVRSVSASNTNLYFIGELLPAGTPYGVFSLRDIDHRNQRGEYGIFLDESVPVTGVEAFEGMFLILDYAFGYLNLNKVCAEVLAENTRALRFDEAFGMKQEGVLRAHLFADGRFQDVMQLALFRDDFYNHPTPVMRSFLAGRGGSPR